MGNVRDSLREATAVVHADLDQTTAGLNFADPTDYRRFLEAQWQPVVALENGLTLAGVDRLLDDWPARTRTIALAHDLRRLDVKPVAAEPVDFEKQAAMWGALYVLEGSRLGAKFLLKRIPQNLACATHFLSHGQGEPLWQTFIARLEDGVAENELDECIAGAMSAFQLFSTAFGATRAPEPA